MATNTKDPKIQMLALKIFSETGSGHAVAKKLGIGSTTAYRLLHAAGADVPNHTDPKPRKRLVSQEMLNQVLADYSAGMKWSQLESKYGVGQYAMREAIRRNGLTLKGIGGQYRVFTDLEKLEIERLYRSGWSQQLIALQFESSQITISRLLSDLRVRARGEKASGEKHGSWNGGVVKTNQGYVLQYVPQDHQMASMRIKTGYVLQHRLNLAEKIGRPLTSGETVHHINGDRSDNRPENLQLRQGKHGKGVVMKCACCGSTDIISTKIAESD